LLEHLKPSPPHKKKKKTQVRSKRKEEEEHPERQMIERERERDTLKNLMKRYTQSLLLKKEWKGSHMLLYLFSHILSLFFFMGA
jgi:hypothetical protein